MPDEVVPSPAPPRPGSDEAIEQGCSCAVLDNGHGLGRFGNGEQFGWWIHDGCPLHGLGAQADEARA